MEVERRATESAAARYQPRRRNQSVFFRCVQEHLETWPAQCRDGYDDPGRALPYVERESCRYLTRVTGNPCPLSVVVGYCLCLNTCSASAGTLSST